MRRRGRTLALRAALSFFLSVSAALSAGTLSGRLVDSEGRPVADARVTWVRFLEDDESLLQETEGREPEVLGETRSDANGAFRAVLDEPGLSIALRVQAA